MDRNARKKHWCILCCTIGMGGMLISIVLNFDCIVEEYYIYKTRSRDKNEIISASTFLSQFGTRKSFQPLMRASECLSTEIKRIYIYGCIDAAHSICSREKEAVLPDVLRVYYSNDAYMRECAMRFLGEMGVNGVPYLRQSLDDSAGRVRIMALSALGRIGPPARGALNDIVRMMSIDDNAIGDIFQTSAREVFEEAAMSLMRIDVISAKAKEILETRGKIGSINENRVARMVYDHFRLNARE